MSLKATALFVYFYYTQYTGCPKFECLSDVSGELVLFGLFFSLI